MRSLPNLAARPFVNRRPLVRVALAAWIVGGSLAAFDAFVYWRYLSGEGRREQRAVELEQSLAEAQERIDAAAETLVSVDLDWQSEQVRFVNLRADEQGFSWSRLFDQLAEVLPDGVRLSRLNPGVGRVDAQRLATEGIGEREPHRVTLSMNGAARSSEELYRFVDALYAHPAFERPDLASESQRNDVEFALTAVYLPGAEEADAATAAPGTAREVDEAEPVDGAVPGPADGGRDGTSGTAVEEAR